MRIFRRSLQGVALLLVLALAAAAVYVWRAFPSLDGELRAPGLRAPVQVRRDASDVTHIEAQSVADAYFALGYVHAQERSWQLEFNRRVMHGELSEVLGPSTLAIDKHLRRLGVMQAARAQFAGLPEATRAQLKAYADGINAFHATSSQALPPEFHILGVKPGAWTPEDSVGWSIMMALDLGYNQDLEFARLSALQRLNTEQLWQLIPPYPGEARATNVDLGALYRSLGVYRADAPAPQKTAQADTLDWLPGGQEGVGSNNWVVAGTHTKSGKPLVVNDPHLGLSAPAIWYFARLKAPAAAGGAPLDVIGATLPGAPVVVLGRTAGMAWAYTNTSSDVQDFYLEQINPDNAKQYRTPTGWADFVQREEVIKVKGQPDEKITVLGTRHGPVLSNGNPTYEDVIDGKRYVLALRWAALDADNQTIDAGLRANYAQSVDQLVASYANYHSPMQNLVAADTGGKTVYRAVGRVPLRGAQNDVRGMAPVPGWEAKYDWAGWVKPEETPHVDDAAIQAKGWLATANQRVVAQDYPYFIGADWVTPERFDRIESLLAKTPRHDWQSMREVQVDQLSLSTRRLLPVLQATQSQHPQAAQALALLKNFDGTMAADQGAPLVFALWADELTRGLAVPKLGEAKFNALYGKRSFRSGLESMLLDAKTSAAWCGAQGCAAASSQALSRALDRIVAQQGSDVSAWRWGSAHPALSGHRPFANVAALARFYDVAVPVGGDGWTVNVAQYWANQPLKPFAARHGPSLRAIYDLADLEQSRFVYQTGQSGLVFSSRYRDMSEQWARVEYRPLQLRPNAWSHQATLTP